MPEPIKIYLADNSLYKTTKILLKYWQTDPRFEVRCDPYWNPLFAEWADVIWVEWTEGAIQRASERGGFYPDVVSVHVQQPPRDYNWADKILINRAIDIEIYYGHFRAVHWDKVNYLTYIAKHIFQRMDDEMHFAEQFPTLKTAHMPLSIDVADWTYRKRDGTNRNVAWINHIWTGKGLPTMLQAFRALLDKSINQDWKFHIVGDWSNEAWQPPYVHHLVKELGLTDHVIFYDRVDSVDQFLEGMDYLVSSSYKEAFSLILAEAMAKGIKVLTHNWIGAKDIWPEEMIWTSIDEFVQKMLNQPYESEKYRALAERYDKKHEIAAFNKLIGLE